MKKYLSIILLLIITFIFSVNNVIASTNTKVRTESDYLVPDNIKITNYNKDKILRTPAVDSTEKVYDFADLFTDSEEQYLYNQINEYISSYKMDLAVVTINENNKNDVEKYADDFYDYNDFGINSSRDGVLFLIDMDTRQIHMTTTGQAIKMYDDERIDDALDLVYQHMTDQEYYTGTNKFINKISEDAKLGVPTSNKNMVIDKDGNVHIIKRVNWFLLLIISIVVSAIVLIILVTKNKLARKATTAEEYLDKDSVEINGEDVFLNTNTIRHKIEHSSGSSGGSSHHSGSSGMSHGGGSRGF
ncbi:MAG: TPM domain-containing protein [bacterium]|nr:TPM domain-containing protein [bacterium]